MSSGGKSPSAPSYGAQIGNANATAGTATSDAAQTMNTATALNANSQANLSGVTDRANSAAGAIANTANQNMQTYGQVFNPLQKTEADQAQAYGSEANIKKLQGQAIGGANTANQAALTNSRAALAAEGVDPASIGGAAMDKQAAIAGAAGVANAGTQAGIQAQQQAFGMENTANTLGLEVGQQGTAGAATGAGVAESGQQGINSTNAGNVNNLTAANTYLNTDINANKSAADITNEQFQNENTQYQNEQAQSAGIGSAIGSIAGIAGMAMMESGGPVPSGAGIPTHFHARGPRMRATRPAVPMGIPAAAGSRGAWTTTDYAQGGPVSSAGAMAESPIPGSTDTKPAMLTPGEFVTPKDVVDFKGKEFFHRQIDSIRAKMNERRAIPVMHPPHQSVHA